MISALLSHLPWEVLAIIAVLVVVALYHFGGKTAALIGAAVAAVAVAYATGKKTERADAQVTEIKHADKIQDRADAARAGADSIPADELRKPSPFERD